MRGVIGIASVKDGVEDPKQLPAAKVYVTEEGEYLFLERTVIEKAIAESLKNLETEKQSLILVAIEIVPMSQRKRRVRRKDARKLKH